MYEKLYNVILKNDADIAVCNYKMFDGKTFKNAIIFLVLSIIGLGLSELILYIFVDLFGIHVIPL